MTTAERNDLTAELFLILFANPGSNKHQLQQLLNLKGITRYSTSHINSILYSNRTLFEKVNETLPLWKVRRSVLKSLEELLQEEEISFDDSFYRGHPPRIWQIEALNQWISWSRKGVIEAVTGTGKTTAGIIAAADAVVRGNDVLILVPGLVLMEQWYTACSNDLTKDVLIGRYGGGNKDTFATHHLIISTIHSARRNELLPVDGEGLLIADEVHGYGAHKSARALREHFKERLGLTATYDRSDDGLEEILSPYFSPDFMNMKSGDEIIAGCGYARGLADEILAKFRVGLIGVDFEPDELLEYEELSASLTRDRNSLIYNHGCPSDPFGEFMSSVQKLNKGGHSDHDGKWVARRYLSNFSKRRSLLSSSNQKTEALNLLIPVLRKANKCLVFTETIESAENASYILREMGLLSEVFHSKLDEKNRRERMLKFRNGEIKILAAPKVLDEGIDVPEADVGVILAASHTKRQMIQRMGRIIRPKEDNRPATFFILYTRNTNEDPALGFQESFLDEMHEHAMEVKSFSTDVNQVVVRDWYDLGKAKPTLKKNA